ncbi:hypothetical protein ACV07N_04310 [Roseivirga echinicomitans]
MISKIGFGSILVWLALYSLISPGIPGENHLEHIPKLTITELDFQTETLTFCMFEGVKLKFKLSLDDFNTNDLNVKISKGEVDLKLWEEETSTYLINPKTDEFQVDVWVKLARIKHLYVPTLNGEIVAHDTSGAYLTTNAVWKPINEVFEVEDAYVKIISGLKLFGRSCE